MSEWIFTGLVKLILSCVETITFMTLGWGREVGLVSTAVKFKQLEKYFLLYDQKEIICCSHLDHYSTLMVM